MSRAKTLLTMLTIASLWIAVSTPLISHATENAKPVVKIDQLVKMRQLQNEQIQLNNLKLNARAEKVMPWQLKALEQANLQKQSNAKNKPQTLGNQFKSRVQIHRVGPDYLGSTASPNTTHLRDVSDGTGSMSLSDANMHYFNFSTGLNGSDTIGMDVNITGNEGVNFGSEGWNSQPGFSIPSEIFFLIPSGSLSGITATPLIDDPNIPWTTISWDWNGGGNGGQPLAVGNIWVIYTRTTHCYVLMEVTDVTADAFSFDYLYQSDGTNIFGEILPMILTVDGDTSATLEIGSNPYFEFTTPFPGESSITMFWDRDNNGLLSDGDIPLSEWIATDGDMHDENPTSGIFAFTFTDEMADGLNYVVGDFVFVAQNGPDFASVPVTFYQNPTPFEILGTITEQSTGQPIEGIIVWASAYHNNDDNNGPDVIAITDISGNYSLFVPDTGMYRVGTFDHLGVTPGLFPIPMAYDVLLLGANIQVDFQYAVPSNMIYGYVSDQYGQPAGNIGVYAYGSDFEVTTYTDSSGYFELGVIPGQYWLGIIGETAFNEFLIPNELEVYVEMGDVEQNITMYRPNSMISGSLVLDNQPWPDMMVFAWNDEVGAGVSFTDMTGNFNIPVFSPVMSGYYLDVSADMPMDNLIKLTENFGVMPGAANQVIAYETVFGGLEGHVFNAITGEVIYDGVDVWAENLTTGMQYYSGPWFEGGMYRMYLPDGMYAVSAGGWDYLGTNTDTISINGELVWQDFYLTPFEYSGAVEGIVYNANDNTPIPNADVWIGGEVWGNWTMTDGNGFYHFDTPNGLFMINVSAPAFEQQWDSVWVNNETVIHDFYLNPYEIGGTLSGRTYGVDSEGNPTPLPWTNLAIYGDMNSFYLQSDEQGYYAIGLPEGSYHVEAYHEGFFPAYEDNIWVSGDVTLDLYLDHFNVDGAVFGYVYDAANEAPITNAEVFLYIPDTPTGYQTWTDHNGFYWLDVQNGNYSLQVFHPNYEPYANTNVNVNNDTLQIDVPLMGFPGAIFGTVWDAETNERLSDVPIYIQSQTDSMMSFFGNTDWEGNYYIGLPNGSYNVTAARWDYDAITQFNIQVNDNAVQVDFYMNYHTWATPPEIRWILDVADDQGRWVRLRFSANGTDWGDYQGFSIWRPRETPGGTFLDFIDYIPFHGMPGYSVVVPTLVDSNATTGQTGDFWSTFIVSGHYDTWNFFDSAPMSGYSIDNIVPGVPQNLTVMNSTPTGITLQWDASQDDDFQYYEVYRVVDNFQSIDDFDGVVPELQVDNSFEDTDV